MNTDTPKRKENIVLQDNTDIKKRKSDHSTKSDNISHENEDETEDETKAIERLLTDPEDASKKSNSNNTVESSKEKSKDKTNEKPVASSFFGQFKTSPFAELSTKQCIFTSPPSDINKLSKNPVFSSSSPFASFPTSINNNPDIFKQNTPFSSSSSSSSSSNDNKTIPSAPSADAFKHTSFFSKPNTNNNNDNNTPINLPKPTEITSHNEEKGNGEENDIILFETRAKGYLFDKEKIQYTHICTGPIRINKTKNSKDILRVIMRQESSETGQGLHVLVHLLIIPATKIVSNVDSKRVTISSIDVRKNNQVETYAISFFKNEDCNKFYNILCDQLALLKDKTD